MYRCTNLGKFLKRIMVRLLCRRKLHKSIDLQGRRKLITYADKLDFIERDVIVILKRGCVAIEGLSLLNGL